MTLEEVAELMTCSTSKISRLETGKAIPKVPDVNELMRIYGVTSETERDMILRLVHDGRAHGWWEPLTEGVQPEKFILDAPGRYPAVESEATMVRSFTVAFVSGLLQTPDYARTVLTDALPHHSPEEIERLVALRMKRQEALHRTDPPPLEVLAVLDEGVLCRPVGGPEMMAAQLEQILKLAELPNVDVRVWPFERGISRAHLGNFVLLTIPEERGSDVVYIEGHAGETFLDSRSDVDVYEEVFADALEQSLPRARSLEVVERYRRQFAS